MEEAVTLPRDHRRLVGKLLLILAAAFIFAFALVPLYNVLCEATGFNGKTASQGGFTQGGLKAQSRQTGVDTSRTLRVEFTGTVMPGLPWDMRPLTTQLDLHPGELQQVSFLVRNLSDQPITGQAVPSVTPGQAAQHFEKIDCFCFAQQVLGPGESREMPLAFIVKPEVDPNLTHITLSYAFFNVDGQRKTLTNSKESR